MIKAADFLSATKAPTARIAIVTGDEDFLRERVIQRLVVAAGEGIDVEPVEGPGARDGASFDLAGLCDTLRTSSLFGGERLVHVRRADALVREHGETLVRLISSGEIVHRLVLEGDALVPKASKGGGDGARKSPAASLAGAVEAVGGVVVMCLPLYDAPFQGRGPVWQSELTRWVVDEARARGRAISNEDAYLLHRLAGTGLRELSAEIGKLVTFTGTASTIAAADIEAAVGAARTTPTFVLADAVADGAGAKALKVSAELFERGIDDFSGRRTTDAQSIAMAVQAALGSRLRRVALVLQHMSNGAGFDDAAGLAGTPPMFRAPLGVQVEYWERRNLPAVLDRLLALERELKTGGGPARLLVDRFLLEAVPPRGARGRA